MLVDATKREILLVALHFSPCQSLGGSVKLKVSNKHGFEACELVFVVEG